MPKDEGEKQKVGGEKTELVENSTADPLNIAFEEFVGFAVL